MGNRLSTQYRLQSKRHVDGYTASFQTPGFEPVEIRHSDRTPIMFDTEDAAIAAAGERMCEILNVRTRNRSAHGTIRMGGADLALALRSADVSPSQLARIFGTRTDRVLNWIDGVEDIPHSVRILLALLHTPGAKELAMEITENVSIEREAADEVPGTMP